jgi:hypothetical protein
MAVTDGSGHGLYATRALRQHETMLLVPRAACLIADYESGMSLPSGAWPRLRKGLAMEPPLTWDLLLVLFRPLSIL